MATTTKIQWTHATFNPWRGCTKVAPECTHCYADTMSKRNPGTLGVWGPNGTRVVAAESYWKQPAKWNREAAAGVCQECGGHGKVGETPLHKRAFDCSACGGSGNIGPHRRRVFCASLADVFEDWQQEMRDTQGFIIHECPNGHTAGFERLCVNGIDCAGCRELLRPIEMADVRRRLFRVIDETPWLDWLLLTKRPQNIRRMWPETPGYDCPRCDGEGDNEEGGLCGLCLGGKKFYSMGNARYRKNCWLLTSAGTQQTADEFIPHLLACRDLVPVLGVSAEPLLEHVCFGEHLYSDYDIAAMDNQLLTPLGGFNHAKLDWVIVGGESGRGARPCHLGWIRSIIDECSEAGTACFVKQIGSSAEEWDDSRREPNTGPFICNRIRDPKGGDMSEWPEDLRVREFPILDTQAKS